MLIPVLRHFNINNPTPASFAYYVITLYLVDVTCSENFNFTSAKESFVTQRCLILYITWLCTILINLTLFSKLRKTSVILYIILINTFPFHNNVNRFFSFVEVEYNVSYRLINPISYTRNSCLNSPVIIIFHFHIQKSRCPLLMPCDRKNSLLIPWIY